MAGVAAIVNAVTASDIVLSIIALLLAFSTTEVGRRAIRAAFPG
jgi:hypothetical protein